MYRLGRVREALVARDLAGVILYDQLNTRYATDATNMQIWNSHNENRYVYVPAEGPVILFDYGGKTFLSEGLPTVDEVRPATTFYYFVAGTQTAHGPGAGPPRWTTSSRRTAAGADASLSTASPRSVCRRWSG